MATLSSLHVPAATLAGTETLTNKTLTTPVISGAAQEDQVSLTGTTPAITGVVQYWTLTGNSTPTSSLADGETAIVHIDDGTAYTITWTMVNQWIGGTAPTLATTGYTVVMIWRVNGTVYGTHVGDLS